MTTCDQVQELVSGMLDDPAARISSELQRHLRSCSECRDFRITALETANEYRSRVRAGIDRLRRMETLRFSGTRKPSVPRGASLTVLVALAAALLMMIVELPGRRRFPMREFESVASTARMAPASPSIRRVPLFDALVLPEPELLELSLTLLLPRRLDEEFLPERASAVEIDLPRHLRF